MARAYASPQPQEYGPDPRGSEWDALRGELNELLDQVEGQVSRQRRQEPDYQSITERMRDLRHQLSEAEPDLRHREALRSVKRAVDRFSDRDEPYAPRQAAYPPNPRDTLQAAIQQIRARQNSFGEAAPRRAEAPPFDALAHAVGGISTRLERLESELRGASKAQTGNVKEIAEQVSQLSHVVELLAGAVGETGQVKRLEAQIAGLAKLIAEGPRVDLGALTQRLDEMGSSVGRLVQRQHEEGVGPRLDDISATVGRLADLQVQFANRVDSSAQSASGLSQQVHSAGEAIKEEVGSIGVGLQRGMAAIEESVRNVYDRIDTIERQTALAPADLERLTDEMARFTEAMKDPQQVETIIDLVDSIHRRIGELDSSRHEVGDLKLDMDVLRATVIEAVEPRFAALEMRIEELNDRVGAPSGDISIGQLEAQVRQLVARMDQTGEQLTGLARLYSAPAEREAPDFEALAELVASRTSEAVSQIASPPAAGQMPLTDNGIEEIERRVSRLLDTARRDGQNEDLTSIEVSIRAVNDRLARLETSLTQREAESARPADNDAALDTAAAPAPAERPDAATVPPTDDPIAPLLAEAASSAIEEAGGSAPAPETSDRDAMPRRPADDAPLRDRPFGDGDGPVRAALEAKNGPRKQHPGLSYEPLPGQGVDAAAPEPDAMSASASKPEFDPASIDRPPRPVSSFDSPEHLTFEEPAPDLPPAADEPQAEPAPSTNTFIAAARRAAQRQQQQQVGKGGGSGSLIARALASVQGAKDGDEKPEPKAEKTRKRGRAGRLLAGDKAARTDWKPEGEPAPVEAPAVSAAPAAPEPLAVDQEATSPLAENEEKPSFLTRHRRPILLAVALAAVALLTLNLVQQRLNQSGGETAPPPADATTDTSSLDVQSPLANEPVASMADSVSGPRVIPIVDSLATASIDPAAAESFMPAGDATTMPMAFAAADEAASSAAAPDEIEIAAIAPLAATPSPVEDELESPVTVEMPPEGIGPEALRRAAAQGDARAQFEVAAIYTEGRAVSEDLAAAAVWYERAAAQGFAPAQYRLGNLYENGRGVEKDLQQARLWYQRAAEAGNRMAMHNLAALYAAGELGKQAFDSAAAWFEQAASRGMRDSQFNLGMLYARGLGVPQSLEDSYKWFSLAARSGDADAAKARDDVARSLDAETAQRLDDEVGSFVLAPIDLQANYAPIGTWSEAFDPGEAITNIEVIRSVQTALSALGYDVGTPDGLAGPKTTQAIAAFERATGMSPSGEVNPRLLAVLGSQPV